MAIAVAFSLLGAFFMVGLYVAGALGALAMLIMSVFSDAPLANIMANRAWTTYTNFLLVAIPLFILMGELVLRSGFAARMYSALNGWVSPIPGGLLHTNIASCAGSSIATAATISRVALPTFRARGYNERMVVGSLAAGGTLGILIPPSILLVVYGLTTGVSIGRLFLAGFLPGAILAGSFMLMIAIVSIVWPGYGSQRAGARLLQPCGLAGQDIGDAEHGAHILSDFRCSGQHLRGMGNTNRGRSLGRLRRGPPGSHSQLRAIDEDDCLSGR